MTPRSTAVSPGSRGSHAAPPAGAGFPRTRAHVPLLLGALFLGGIAHAEGEIELRGFSVNYPQTLLDAFTLRGRYQSPGGQGSTYGGDFNLSTAQQGFSVRYSAGRNSLQGQFRRQVTSGTDSSTSGTFSYSFSPPRRESGASFTSSSVYYAYSGTTSATQSVNVQTAGASVSARLTDTVGTSLSGSVSRVSVEAGDYSSQQTSGSVSGNVNYSQGPTSAYVSPSVSFRQGGDTTWSVGLGARTRVADQVALAASGYVTPTSSPTASVEALYDAGRLFGPDVPRNRLTVGAFGSLSSGQVSFGARVRSVLSPALSLGSSVSYTPATSAVTVGADVSGRVAGLSVSLNSSVATTPTAAPAFSVSGSVSAQSAPWYGSVYGSYRRQGETQSASASGTFGYRHFPFDVGVTLALTAYPQLAGTADLTAAYAVTDRFDVSGSVRYERGSGTDAAAHVRYGAGIRYRF